MADTTVQLRMEKWVLEKGLPAQHGLCLKPGRRTLQWGGSFDFDGISGDGETVACISTATARTATGRPAVGKYHKIRSDALFLLHAVGATRQVLVFTDKAMADHFRSDQERGRFPNKIEILWVRPSLGMDRRLASARAVASQEVSPRASGKE